MRKPRQNRGLFVPDIVVWTIILAVVGSSLGMMGTAMWGAGRVTTQIDTIVLALEKFEENYHRRIKQVDNSMEQIRLSVDANRELIYQAKFHGE